MRETDCATVVAGRGIDTENRKKGQREITLLSEESWSDVCHELGATIPWHARRANLLIGGIDLASAMGSVLQIGEVRIRIHGETKPCNIMETQHAGLRDALKPNQRGGVHGEVLVGGTLSVGDIVTIEHPK